MEKLFLNFLAIWHFLNDMDIIIQPTSLLYELECLFLMTYINNFFYKSKTYLELLFRLS